LAILSEILALLDKWPEWKRVREAPARIDALEKRLAALEVAPKAAAGKQCLACGEPASRRTSSKKDPGPFGMMGAKIETWTCGACGDTEEVHVDR